jgi:2-methylcitrate dehydratase PrpD
MRDPRILEQRAKVELIADASLKEFMPVRVAIAEVKLKNGEVFTQRVDAVRGTPRNPMSEQEVIFKANDLIAPVLGTRAAHQLIDKVMHIEQMKSLSELSALLQKKTS